MVYSSPTVPTSTRIPLLAAAVAKLAGSAQALAIADQIVVSGASFAATLLVGRTNSAALGEYSIAVSIVALVLAVQNALVLLPFTISQHRTDAEESVDPADALALSTLLSGTAMALCFAAALTLALLTSQSGFTALTTMLAAVMPFVALREFARRYALARLRMRVVLALDVSAAVLQMASLGALAFFDATKRSTPARRWASPASRPRSSGACSRAKISAGGCIACRRAPRAAGLWANGSSSARSPFRCRATSSIGSPSSSPARR
jgi:hypothetical protein